MASISLEKSTGKRTVQFIHPTDGKRRSIRLGKVSKSDAELVAGKIEDLCSAMLMKTAPDPRTAEWIGQRPELADKFAACGLIPKRIAVMKVEVAKFLDEYFAKRKDVKPATQVAFGRVRRHLVEYFGKDRALSDITLGDADGFQLYLRTELRWKLSGADEPQKPVSPGRDCSPIERSRYDEAKADYQRRTTARGLSENTVRRHIGYARQFFKVALRQKLIKENPFIDLKAGSVANPDRQYFVTAEDTYRVLEACPDMEYRLIVALARFGGLRTPSETFALEWSHVDWAQSRITIPSPKTEHHAGHASRLIPLFPELRPFLEAAWDSPAAEGAKYVIQSYRSAKKNLRTRFERIIQRAGLNPWPRLFQNLRSSRETELAERFPIQVVVSWLGNSIPVAKKHYLQVTEDHFAKAIKCSALQNPVQSTHAGPRLGSPSDNSKNSGGTISPDETQLVASGGEIWREMKIPAVAGIMGGTGLEPVTPSV